MVYRITDVQQQGLFRQLNSQTGEFLLRLFPFLNVVGGATFSIGAEAANAIPVTIQIQNQRGQNLNQVTALRFYLSSDAAGLVPAVLTSNPAATTGAVIDPVTNSATLLTNAAGLCVLSLTDTGAITRYVNIVTPGGQVITSPGLVWI